MSTKIHTTIGNIAAFFLGLFSMLTLLYAAFCLRDFINSVPR